MLTSSSSDYREITPNVNEAFISKFNSISTSPSFKDNEINASSSNRPSTTATVNLPLTGVNSTPYSHLARDNSTSLTPESDESDSSVSPSKGDSSLEVHHQDTSQTASPSFTSIHRETCSNMNG